MPSPYDVWVQLHVFSVITKKGKNFCNFLFVFLHLRELRDLLLKERIHSALRAAVLFVCWITSRTSRTSDALDLGKGACLQGMI